MPAYAISVAVLEGVVFSFGIPFLLYSGYRNVRAFGAPREIDPRPDAAFAWPLSTPRLRTRFCRCASSCRTST